MKQLIIFFVCLNAGLYAQNSPDSVSRQPTSIRAFVAPTALIVAGLATLNTATKQWQSDWHAKNLSGFDTRLDDGLQFVPNLAWFGMSLAGVKGRHAQRDQIMLGGIANALAFTLMYGGKHAFNVQRPDGTGLSFPSGHTTNAFVGAAMLHKEYGGQNAWYSVAGYGLATSVGFLRMANNRHWLADVLAGAGTGILATEITYAVYPWLKRKIFKSEKIVFMPIYNAQFAGIILIKRLD